MGSERTSERVHVELLAELDALVSRHITGEKPRTHWEDAHAHLHFDSLEEALEALREPYFQQFIPEAHRGQTVLREVEEYRCFSADLDLAWEVVACLGHEGSPLRIWHEGDSWHAAFGESEPSIAATAPIAICVAGLHLRGVEVELPGSGFGSPESSSRLASPGNRLQPDLLAD